MDTSYLTTQVSTIVGQLHGLFDEIGVPAHDRESREAELFTALSETLHNQLKLVTAERSDLTEEAYRIIKTIRQLRASLEDHKPNDDYALEDEELKVYTPLLRCVKALKEKHNVVAKLHRERFEQIKKLVVALESYSSHLESSFLTVALPPTGNNVAIPPTFDLSPSYLAALDHEFSRVYEEYARRLEKVKTLAEEIVSLWAELGTPQAQTESTIVANYRDSPEQLGLHEADIKRLQAKHEKLIEEKRFRERKLKEIKSHVEALWDRLAVEDMDRKRFLAGTRGCGLRVINDFEAELDRLNELKRQNLHLFVEDSRYKLQALWDQLYFSEEEMLEFTPAFSDVYSDALLSAHEDEIARLDVLREQRRPILQLIDKHKALIQDREELAASSHDASRLTGKGAKRDPTRLLREEKMRKRITKDLPKVEAELKHVLDGFEHEYGRPFLVQGESYLEELAAAQARAPPPRSKTPSIPMSAPKSVRPTPASSRAGSVMRPPPPRSGAKTPPTALRRQPPSSSALASALGRISPSKIPARAPLSTMKHGNNSPERRAAAADSRYESNTLRKMGPPARAPPPKMRPLDHVPAAAPAHESENWTVASEASYDGGLVRHLTPDEPYDTREHMSYAPPASHHNTTPKSYRDLPPPSHAHQSHPSHEPPLRPDSRQTSNTSSVSQAISGSENWETYDDASEPELDATDAYYAKLKAAAGKRYTPDGGHASPGLVKRARGDMPAPEPGRGMVRVASDAAWTDEDAF